MQFFKHSRKISSKKVNGQGMSEYLIIVGLVAVAGIAAMGLLGNIAKTNVSAAAVELSGGDGSTALGLNAGRQTAANAEGTAANTATLSNFDSHARIQ